MIDGDKNEYFLFKTVSFGFKAAPPLSINTSVLRSPSPDMENSFSVSRSNLFNIFDTLNTFRLFPTKLSPPAFCCRVFDRKSIPWPEGISALYSSLKTWLTSKYFSFEVDTIFGVFSIWGSVELEISFSFTYPFAVAIILLRFWCMLFTRL